MDVLPKKLHNPEASKPTEAVLRLTQLFDIFDYLEDVHCSISSSLAENCVRPFVIGRKNWLSAGSRKGAAASAEIYTLAEAAKQIVLCQSSM